jgi:WD40 repeat protein
MRILKGIPSPIYDVEFSPDGRLLLVSTLWDSYHWDLLAGTGPHRTVHAIRIPIFTPTGNSVLGLSGENTLCESGLKNLGLDERHNRGEIDLANRHIFREARPVPSGPGASIKAIGLSPDHSRVVAVATLNLPPLLWWAWPDLTPLAGWPAHSSDNFYPTNLSFAPDGRTLAVLASGAVELRETAAGGGCWKTSIPFHYRDPRLTFSGDGRFVATSNGRHILILSAKQGEIVGQISLQSKHVQALAFTPDHRYLAAVSNEATVKFYDTASWRLQTELAWQIGPLRCLAFSRDGMLAAAAGAGKKVVVWDFDL